MQDLFLRRLALSAFVFAAALWLSAPAQAQSERPFYNLKEFGLEVFGLDEDAHACGIYEDAIEAAAMTVARRMPFKMFRSVEHHALLSFMISTFRASDRCITHVYLRSHYSLPARLPHERVDDLARIELWWSATFVVTRPDQKMHLMAVVDNVRKQMENLADDWREQNVQRL